MKSVLITGGAKRLGRALVQHFAAAGWQVFFTARSSFRDGVALAEELGPNVRCVCSAVSSRADAGMIRSWVETMTEHLDLLVCNASTYSRLSIEQTMPSDFEDLLQSNLLGPFFMAQQFHDLLKRCNGNIVNIADSQFDAGLPEFSAYLAAKAALVSITKSSALEWAPDIRVNAVLPGTMPWPSNMFTEADRAAMEHQIPLKRTGEWLDVVRAIQFLNDSTYMTGSCLTIDGGRSAVY